MPINVSGGSSFNMQGTFYAARATLKVTGNSNDNLIGSQYVSAQLEVNGTADLTIDWHADKTARVRTICLVE